MLQRVMSRFSVENDLSHSAEKSRSGILSLSLISDIENVWMRRWWVGLKVFRQKFLLTAPKNFVGQPFSVSLVSGIETFYASEGYVTIFQQLFCLAVPKTLQGNPSVLCFRKIPIRDKFMDKKGGGSVKMFRRTLCLTVPKIFVAEPFRMSLISGMEKYYA